jgi:hypothetical protein
VDIVDRADELRVTIRHQKQKRCKTFICTMHPEEACCPVRVFRRYRALRPGDEVLKKVKNPPLEHAFLRYEKGKCMAGCIGKKTIAEFPLRIATFLKLATPSGYTGHAFRRTGATSAVSNGASIEDLMRLGDWQSDAVARGYVNEGEVGMRKRAHLVQGTAPAKVARTCDVPNVPPASLAAPIRPIDAHIPAGAAVNFNNCQIANVYFGSLPGK